ncbi:T9SS type A sorting domain-containing protein [Candidatus Poribacteria bacterium]|nr:T9SS type A sorting domain-containing protein [Candidatus Poribacteria bacterium]
MKNEVDMKVNKISVVATLFFVVLFASSDSFGLDIIPTGGDAYIKASPESVSPGENISVEFSGAPGYETDWIGLFELDAPNEAYVEGFYLMGYTAGVIDEFTVPDVPAGQVKYYQFRMFPNDAYEPVLAVSNTITVLGQGANTDPPSVSTSLDSVGAGQPIIVTYSNAPGNAGEKIVLYSITYSIQKYEYQLDGNKNGSLNLLAPVDPGEYEYRLVDSQGLQLAVSGKVLVVGELPPITPPADGMVAYWRFDEGSGITAADSSGYNHHGTLKGNIDWVTGKSGKAVEFDGSSVVEVPHSSDLSLGAYTLLAWIKVPAVTGDWQAIICKEGSWPQRNYGLYVNSSGTLHHSAVSSGYNYAVDSDVSVVDNQWHHICGTYDGKYLRLYVDGEYMGEKGVGGSPDLNTAPVSIGSKVPLGMTLKGVIDEVIIYNIALDNNEIKTIMKQGPQSGVATGRGEETCVSVPDHSYTVVTESKTWRDAKAYAESLGGYLITIGSEQENKCAADMATAKGIRSFWLGLSDEAQEGNFVWVTGEPVTYTNWYSGQPDNNGNNEHYVEMGYPDHPRESWNDNVPTRVLPFIVEFNQPAGGGGTQPPVDPGMVSYWKFDDTSGTTAEDSADSNPGTVRGAAWTTGISNGALQFDGVDDAVIVPDANNLDVTTHFTLEAWINPAGTGKDSSGSAIISKIGGAAGNNGYQLGISQDNTQIFLNFNAPGETWYGNHFFVDQTIPVNQWSYIVGTYDNADLKIYFNGVLVGSKSLGAKSVVNSSANVMISGDDNNHVYFYGMIDEAVIRNVALTQQEIQQRYTAMKGGNTAAAGLVSHWRFDEGQGTDAMDSEDGNHGKVVSPLSIGSPWKDEGKFNAAFDGHDYNYVKVSHSDNLDLTDAFTMEAWIYPDILRLSDGPIISKRVARLDDPGWESGYELLVSEDLSQVIMSFYDAGEPSTEIKLVVDMKQLFAEGKINGESLPYWAWSHIAATYDSNTGYLRIYVNGALFGVKDVGLMKVAKSDSDLWIGGNNKKYFQGRIDEVKIYNVALSAAEIENNYKGITGGGTTPGETDGRKLIIPEVTGSPGDQITVPINISDATGVAGADIEVSYNSSILTVGEIKSTTLSNGMSLVSNTNTPGTIIIRLAGTSSISSGDGALVDITFTISAGASVGTETPVTFQSAEAYNAEALNLNITTQNGKVKIEQLCVKGDVNGDGYVRSNDAILALRISAGLLTPTAQQLCAADMNDDGNVRSNDCILILRKSAGLAAPDRGSVAVVRGNIRLSVDEVYSLAGRTISVPLRIDNPRLLAGGDISIAYDPSVLKATGVPSDSGMLLVSNVNNPGMVSISFASSDVLEKQKLTEIEFEVLTDEISPIALNRVELYQPDVVQLNFEKQDGKFVSWAVPADHDALLQNFPNPFNPETWIPYQLTEGCEVKISVYSMSGELVRKFDLGHKPAGLYISSDRAVYWNGRNSAGEDVSSGVYFYTIQAGDRCTYTRKMIVTR